MDRLAELAEYDRSIPGLIDDDFLAAGFTPEEIASYRGTFTPPSLTPQDIAQAEQTYGTLQAPDYTMRETSTQRVQDALINQLGIDPYLAGRYARDIMGDTSPTSQNILDGLGLADLTPLGAVFAVEEGGGTAVEGYQEGDYLKMGLGVAEAGLGVAEAFPLTRPIAEGAGVLAREVYSSPYMADAIGTLRGIRDFDADFLLGRGDPAMAQGVGADVVGGAPAKSIDDQIAELDVEVAALRQTVLDNPTDTAAFDEYKSVRQMRNDLKDQRATARAEARNVAPAVEEPVRTATEDEGFEAYLETVNPGGKRVAAEDRPNLAMGDMYGMLPRNSEVVGSQGDTTFYRGSDGNYYATAFNPDVGEEDVVGYITDRGDSTELAVVQELQGQGIGGELQYLFRKENPDAPTGGLTEAGEASLRKTYQRLADEGVVDGGVPFGGASAPDIPEAPVTVEGIKAFHGSPYDFDRFDLSFMGAGEGAQEYGKGLYFAEMQNVAEGYKNEIFAPADPSAFSSDSARELTDQTLQAFGARPGALKAAVSDLKASLSNEQTTAKFFGGNEQRISDLNEAINYLENNVQPGKLYEVNIKADQGKMLDFDRPMSEQPQEVQEVLEPYFQMRVEQMGGDPEALRSKLQGGDIMMLEKTNKEMAGEISKALSDAGIPGVRYMDQQSRAKQFEVKLSRNGQPYETEQIVARNQREADKLAEEYRDKGFDVDVEDIRTRNFVVFDEGLIDIVKKHGFAGLMVGAAVQAGMGQEETSNET